MGKLTKVQGLLKLGGPKAILLKVGDKLTGASKLNDYLYELQESAEPNAYRNLLENYYMYRTGEKLDLDQPRTFNEKIQWLKLYDSTPEKTRLADKYLVREWIKEKIGEQYLVPLLGVWDSFDGIDFNSLPDRFVLKCNHGSGWNLIVEDKRQLDIADAKRKFDKWMSMNFAFCEGLELHYRDIKPKIIAEKYLEAADGLKDYRFYCFNGVSVQCWVDLFSGTPNHIRSVYDMDWNKLDFRCTWPDGEQQLSEKPRQYEKMKEFARVLCKDFSFVRVDFFEVSGKLYMGEMTFTPMGGYGHFIPSTWDYQLGKYLCLPIDATKP